MAELNDTIQFSELIRFAKLYGKAEDALYLLRQANGGGKMSFPLN
jgi:hypothetical protein